MSSPSPPPFLTRGISTKMHLVHFMLMPQISPICHIHMCFPLLIRMHMGSLGKEEKMSEMLEIFLKSTTQKNCYVKTNQNTLCKGNS